MRISQMSNEQLVEEYGILSAKEATWTPGSNGRGRKTFQALTDRRAKVESEIIRRMNTNAK